MRILLFVLITILLFKPALAQKIRFTDTSNRWTILGSAFVSVPVQVISTASYLRDTTLNGMNYKIMPGAGYVREDTIANIVYTRQSGIDTAERILYNYNLKLNDSVQYIIPNSVSGNDTYLHKVIRLDSVSINGYFHKIWTFHYLGTSTFGGYPDYIVIEGIGCNDGLFFPFQPWIFEKSTQLICFSHNGNTIYAGFLTPGSCALSVNDKAVKENSVKLWPNPVNENSKLEFSHNITGMLSIINVYGQQVYHKILKGESEFYIGNAVLTPGAYYYKISDNNSGNNFTGKFVFQ